MAAPKGSPNRIHVIAHAGGTRQDLDRLGFADAAALLAHIREHLPAGYRLTAAERFFEVVADDARGGRRDDTARIKDLQAAINDPRTLAIVSANGGAYLTRILPHVDFSPLARRRDPFWAFGFSEITTLVNLVASYRCGRGVYWLCPNFLGWKIRPREDALGAVAEFWRTLPAYINGNPAGLAKPAPGCPIPSGGGGRTRTPKTLNYLDYGPIQGNLATGRAKSGTVRLIGGCLSVLCAFLTGGIGKRLRPDGKWLALEDIHEDLYRLDRYFAALKLAGWLDRIAGLLLGDFHTKTERDQHAALLELLRYHLPPERKLPVITTRSFGHVWPMVPLPLNQPLRLDVRGRSVTIASPGRAPVP